MDCPGLGHIMGKLPIQCSLSFDAGDKMPNTLQSFISALDLPFSGDEMVANVIQALFKSGLTRGAGPLVSIIRRQHGGDLVGSGKAPHADLPRGPFRRGRRATGCDLLIFDPRSLESFFIDDVTGGYG